MKGHASVSNFLRWGNFLFFYCFALTQVLSQFQITIVDEDRQPLIGVEVYNDDYSFTAVSDLNGAVTVTEEQAEQELNFNYLGYAPAKILARAIINKGGIISLEAVDEIIEEIIVVGRNELAKEALPYTIQSLKIEEISKTNPQTAADALAQHADVYVQKSQMGGGSPVLRGFEANKVLLVVDGVRMNNAIYRNGHLQNAITVDQAMLDQMEVIFGPNALIYGSDALGGVIHFRTKLPKLSFGEKTKGISDINYYGRYSSANNERSAHVDFNISSRKLASLTSLTFSKFGDLRAGAHRPERYPDFGKRSFYIETIDGEDNVKTNDNPDLQIGTAYDQIDILQKFLYQANDNLQLIYNFQFSNSSNVPRYDMLTVEDSEGLRFAEWYYGPQKRVFSSFTMKHNTSSFLYDKAIAIVAFQKIDEDRADRSVGEINRYIQEEDVNVWNVTLDFHKGQPNDKHKFYYGIDINLNDVGSSAYDLDIKTNIQDFNVFSRYPSDGSSMTTGGIYAQYHLSNDTQLKHLNIGLRYTANKIKLKYNPNDPIDWPSELTQGIESTSQALIGSAGYVYNTTSGWQMNALVSTAFRTPNIDDMAKIRVRRDEVSFPNTDLLPERSINGEITLAKEFLESTNQKTKLKLSATLFATRLKDAIIREPFAQQNGSSILVSRGDTFNIFANVNASEALVYGLSMNAMYNLSPKLSIKSNLNWTKGDVTSPIERPLSHIPPVYGRATLNYTSGSWSSQLVCRYNMSKPLERYGDSSDNPEYATPEGTLAWNTWNLYGDYNLSNQFNVSLGVENIFDLHYRTFASGLSAPGRNFILTLKGRF